MSRFGNPANGLIVSVADEKDDRYSTGWKKLAEGETLRPTRRRQQQPPQHSDPTPSGSIRRPHVEETPTGQIRRQQAQDPFGNR